jgi:hypothetical protein
MDPDPRHPGNGSGIIIRILTDPDSQHWHEILIDTFFPVKI